MKNIWRICLVASLAIACKPQGEEASTDANASSKEQRIVSLKGAYSEVLAAFGLEDQLVGVDVTSNYPESIADVPRVGHTRNLSAEGILALNPTRIIADPTDFQPEVKEQLESTGLDILWIEQEYTLRGAKDLLIDLAEEFGVKASEPEALIASIDNSIALIDPLETAPKVLFIYARGAGTLMVAGEDTQMDYMISLAGGENAVSGFSDFMPLTPEALVAANPDVVLMFSSGKKSLNGKDGIMQIPGMSVTTAGQKGHIIDMDGQFISGFGPRVGQAALELNRELRKLEEAVQ